MFDFKEFPTKLFEVEKTTSNFEGSRKYHQTHAPRRTPMEILQVKPARSLAQLAKAAMMYIFRGNIIQLNRCRYLLSL